MINKKKTLSVLGRRNKQQILKDVLRPGPSATVSAPSVGGGVGEGRGGCTPGGTSEGAPGTLAYCVETFSRTVADGWGTSEFFEHAVWEDHSGAFNEGDSVADGFGILGGGGDEQCEAPMGIPMQVKMDFKLDGNPAGEYAFDLFCFHDYDLNVGFYTFEGEAFLYVVNDAAFDEIQVDYPIIGTIYSIRFDITDSSLSAAFWQAGTPEPAPQVTLSGTTLPVSTNELRITSFFMAPGDTVQFDRIETIGTLKGDITWVPFGDVMVQYCSFDDFYQTFDNQFASDAWVGFHPGAGVVAHGAFSNEHHLPNNTHFMKTLSDLNRLQDEPTLGEIGTYNSLYWVFTGSWIGPDSVTFKVYGNVIEEMPPLEQDADVSAYWTGGLFLGEVTMESDAVIGGRKVCQIPVPLVTSKDFSNDVLRYETEMTNVGLDLHITSSVRGIVGCESISADGIGYYFATLASNGTGYASGTSPAYYVDVYFDGGKVFKDDHYTVDNDMNIIPNVGITPTSVQASYVIR